MSEDEELTVKLPLRTWRIVSAIVEGGVYRDVYPILDSMHAQVNSQITAANDRVIAQAVQREIQATAIASPSDLHEGLAEDPPGAQLNSQPALH